MILRLATLSVPVSGRALRSACALGLCAAAVALLALWVGHYPLALAQLFPAIAGDLGDVAQMVVRDHRLPRILCALGVGAGFGMAGAIFQTLLRNPLASPDVIGFNGGASCGALLAIILTGGHVVAGALLGGLASAALVIGLAWRDGLQPYRLILVGIGASLTLSALGDLLMSRMDVLTAADMAKWLIGTLASRDWQDVALIWGGLAVLGPVVLWASFPLARLSMSDDVTTGLGLALTPLRLGLSAIGVGLVALAVSVAGPLPFVAFVSGPIARCITGGGRPAIGAAALVGALVVTLADLAARMVPLVHLPAGVFTALIGAPVLMWLLVVQFRKGRF
ncbi:MAG: iron chelate uptake ABC transporter family permease subunit [Marinibacterium sp.]|nr:iron chelate uptake ABC transporter family permease subunit [Marinibacterium sp.]